MPDRTHFRADIQGLRAIAVLAVVLYHAHMPGVPGGFVGVDIFFVVSGYLICGLLRDEMTETGEVDIARFWLRRARRLLPNACLTLLAILIASVVILPGYRLPLIVRSVTASALYFANLHFAGKATDYFGDTDAPDPTLHFWSLSLEEQFYLAWPLLLTILAKTMPRGAVRASAWATALVLAGSLALSLMAIRFDQPVAFYHGEMRAWEFASGGLLALLQPVLAERYVSARSILAWLGIAGIATSLIAIDNTMSFPGVLALLPVVSTVAVLAAPRSGSGGLPLPATLLASNCLQWLGNRSYSLYLWHWPALVMTDAALHHDRLAAPLGLGIGLALACGAYRWVERPLRIDRSQPRGEFNLRWRIPALSAAAVVGILIGCQVIARMPLLQSAADAAITRQLKLAANDHGRNYFDHCHLTLDEVEEPACTYGAKAGSRRAVLFGDSHASQWFAALDLAANRAGWRLEAWTKSSCPTIEVAIWYAPRHARFTACERWLETMLARLTGADRPERVFIANRIDYDGYILDPATGALASRSRAEALWREGFHSVLQRLLSAGIAVTVIRDTPKAAKDYADCLSQALGRRCDKPRAQALPALSPDVEAAQDLPGVEIADLTDAICGPVVCPVMKDGQVIYEDWNHLTATFTASLARAFERYLPMSRAG